MPRLSIRVLSKRILQLAHVGSVGRDRRNSARDAEPFRGRGEEAQSRRFEIDGDDGACVVVGAVVLATAAADVGAAAVCLHGACVADHLGEMRRLAARCRAEVQDDIAGRRSREVSDQLYRHSGDSNEGIGAEID